MEESSGAISGAGGWNGCSPENNVLKNANEGVMIGDN
jgi:hypothetical protein